MPVPLDDLQVGRQLGDGGQAEVYEVTNRPGEAFKRYRASALQSLRADLLEELAAETAQLSLEGKPITYWATWPTQTVTEGGRVIGFLMPMLDASFSMSEGNLKGKHASFSYLASRPAPLWGPVNLPDQQGKLRLLALLAGVMQQLHHRGMVVGDLSWANVLWSIRPELRVILLDCDGIRPPSGTAVVAQLDSPDWNDPLAPANTPPDADRDCYKLSLMVIRVLTRDLNVRPSPHGNHALGAIPAEIASLIDGLLVRAAGPVGTRPTATEWRQALQGRAIQLVSLPATAPPGELTWPDGVARPAVTATERRFRPVEKAPTPATGIDGSAAAASKRPDFGSRRWRPVTPDPRQS